MFLIFLTSDATAQKKTFTRQDTLRGSYSAYRSWWDLTYYHLEIEVLPDQKYIQGQNTIQFKSLEPGQILQIDLQNPLEITAVRYHDQPLTVETQGAAHFIHLPKMLPAGQLDSIQVFYAGHPHEAKRAPWEGGFTWSQDDAGKQFIATSCQGIGASIWWPCKDHMKDEPDSVLLSVTVPKGLYNVSNGRLRSLDTLNDGRLRSHWFVGSPIANYGVNINIGDYVHSSQPYQGEGGLLNVDVYVLRENERYLKRQFLEIQRMLKAFEFWFGPYPFYDDGYKLVEVPYLGMEHQSSITYGNGYINGYKGIDLSGSGWGLLFDFIIIHESGHEWFANNITYQDRADMWIHEGFTNYSESLFLDYHYGRKASSEYCIGTRSRIQNDRPIIAAYGVNAVGSGDMYYKGGNMLHTLRYWMQDDEQFRQMLRALNKTFFHQTVTTAEVESFMEQFTGLPLGPFFDQYLRDTRIPTLHLDRSGDRLIYYWSQIVPGFSMPIDVIIDGNRVRLEPSQDTQFISLKPDASLSVDPNFYVQVEWE